MVGARLTPPQRAVKPSSEMIVEMQFSMPVYLRCFGSRVCTTSLAADDEQSRACQIGANR